MKLLAEGAEARIYATKGTIVKKREPKGYRIKVLDKKLRLFRTKREAKILEKLGEAGIPVPRLISSEESTLKIERIYGRALKDVLSARNYESISKETGKGIGLMHANNVIHGDLTTSNMIYRKGKVCFIDFGLGFFSEKTEDKAVDLHLLNQALNASHAELSKKCFSLIMTSYLKTFPDGREVLKRLEEVESRGRYKRKTGKT